jgi:hypothetical protein
MKIDLYNNHQVFVQESRQDRKIKKWCWQLGLSYNTIMKHPHLADIRVLIDLRNHWTHMSEKDQTIWNKAWRHVYEHEYPLNEYYKRLLVSIVDGIEYRKSRLEQSRIEYQARVLKRQKIKQRIKKREQKLAAV